MWIEIDEDYLMYLRDNGDPRVPQQNYGKNKFKPFFKLFSLGEIVYVTSVTSPKEKYKYFKEDLDFTKLKDKDKQLIGVVHTNFMFPVLEKNIRSLTDAEIIHILGGDTNDKNNYVSRSLERLKKYETLIRQRKVYDKAVKHYLNFENKKLRQDIHNRTLDFELLEEKLVKYEFDKVFKDNDVEVLLSMTINTIFVDIDDTRYTISHTDLYDLESLKEVHENEPDYEYTRFQDYVDYDI